MRERVLTVREMALVSRSRNRAGGNCNLDRKQSHQSEYECFCFVKQKKLS